jgi:predicted enzyme related to lactoylglutathione lyase
MTIAMRMITIDCAEPKELVPFWTAATGYGVVADLGEFVVIGPADEASAPALGLQRVPDVTPGKNRVHIDFHTDDREAEVARLVALGASRVGQHEYPGFAWVVLADPAGNQFCVA